MPDAGREALGQITCPSRWISATAVERVWESAVGYAVVAHDSERFSGVHRDRAFSRSRSIVVTIIASVVLIAAKADGL